MLNEKDKKEEKDSVRFLDEWLSNTKKSSLESAFSTSRTVLNRKLSNNNLVNSS